MCLRIIPSILCSNARPPQFSNQDSRLGPVIEKAKKLSTLQYPRSISVTSAILISKVQLCLTSSDMNPVLQGSIILQNMRIYPRALMSVLSYHESVLDYCALLETVKQKGGDNFQGIHVSVVLVN